MSTRSVPHDVVVVGAGLAGLVAASTAAAAGLSVVVLDPHPVGGRARTTVREGWSLNQGPHALYEHGALAGFLRRAGITLPGGDPTSYPSSGWRDGVLHPLPYTPASLLRTKLLTTRGKVRFARLYGSIRSLDPGRLVGRSVSDWLGSEPADVVDLVETLVRTTTFVNAPDRLDAAATVEQLRLGLAGVRYLDGGWQRIVDALHRQLVDTGIHFERAEALTLEPGEQNVAASTSIGAFRARSVIVAAGGPRAEASLLGTEPQDVGDCVEATCLDLLLDRPARRAGAFGVGTPLYLTPHSAAAELAPPGHGLLSGLHYLRPGSAPAGQAEESAALEAMALALGNPVSAVVDRRYLHRITVAHSFPDASRGGLGGRPGVSTGRPGVFRAGDWVGGHGFLSDASAASAIEAATAAVARCVRISA